MRLTNTPLRTYSRTLLLLPALALVTTACGDDDDDDDDMVPMADAGTTTPEDASAPMADSAAPEADASADASADAAPATSTLTLTMTGLEPLAGGYHYEGWAIVGGSPVPTGKFNLDANGAIVAHPSGTPVAGGAFTVDQDISAATAVVISIEPAGDVDAIPAATKVLGGDVASGSATLSIAHGAALGTDLASAAGSFILATPTDTDPNNETHGVWFLSMPGPTAGLTLPTLPAGWVYEGWGVFNVGTANMTPLSTGRFTMVSGADSASTYSGPEPAPAFPGEDFVANLPAAVTSGDLTTSAMVVVSIEPEPDDSPAPFALKPLVQTDPGTNMTLVNESATNNPTGSATIQ